jgi:hypothetical protein
MNNRLDNLFPVAVYQAFNVLSEGDNQKLISRSLEIMGDGTLGSKDRWIGNTFTTHSSSTQKALLDDPVYKQLADITNLHVSEFAKAQGSFEPYECGSMWLNIASSEAYQEMHSHDGSIISAVYYPSVPTGSGNIEFEDPKPIDMLPLKNKVCGGMYSSRMALSPTPRQLVIFRSWLRHRVLPGKNTEPRISIAFNYV